MKKNLGKKNWMFSMPVLMIGTYGEGGTPDVMNAAWGGITVLVNAFSAGKALYS